jgi:peptide/nickel transport system substrate-binding protein
MKKKFLAVLLGAVVTASVLAGCGGGSAKKDSGESESAAAGEMVEGGDFIKGVSTEAPGFDPFTIQTADAGSIFFNIYEGLMRTETDGSFSPALAETCEVSDDLQTYTFTLREGVKFHNGNELTMDDVLYSIQKAIDSSITGFREIDQYSANGNTYTVTYKKGKDEEGKEVEIPEVKAAASKDAPADAKTLVIHLDTPDSGFPAVVTCPIVPKDAKDLATNPIGTGPFMLTEFVEQDYTRLEKFEDYWGEPAHLDSVTLKYYENTAELATNYLAGAIDGFNSNAGGWKELEGTDYVQNVRHANAVQLLALNNEFGPFKDVRVRQAVAYAVDPDEIIETVSYGLGTKAGTPVIPGLEKYFNDELTDVYDVDVDKAKALLKEAGQENLSFTIRVPSNYQVHVDTAQVISNQLAKAGITVNIESVDWNTWLTRVYQKSEFEATVVAVDGPTAFPTSFLKRYVSTASDNFVKFKSKAFDETYEKATLETDDAEQVKLFKECQKILSDECSSVYIQDISSVVVNSPKFGGFKAYPLYVDDYSAMYSVQ